MAQLHRQRRELSSVPFTLTIDKQEGRRFSGTLSSSRGTETVIAVISQSGTIYMVDDDGYSLVTMLAPNRLEFLLSFAVPDLARRFLHRVYQAALAGC